MAQVAQQPQELPQREETVDLTLTTGKACFDDVYDDVDAAPYMRAMGGLDYVIGDHTTRVSRRAVADLCAPIDGASSGEETESPSLQSVPVVMELCAGYGLSCALLRTHHTSATMFEYFFKGELPRSKELCSTDYAFINSRPRTDGPKICVLGVDVSSNALTYGKRMGLYDAILAKNLENPETVLTDTEAALLARAQVVLATGAFSYISAKTLSRVFSACAGAPPVFLFYPLVATDAKPMCDYFLSQGMQVFYEPSKYWLPQRRFADDHERKTMSALEAEKAAGNIPMGKREGYIHACPLIAAPPGIKLAELAVKWIVGEEGSAGAAAEAEAEENAAPQSPAAAKIGSGSA